MKKTLLLIIALLSMLPLRAQEGYYFYADGFRFYIYMLDDEDNNFEIYVGDDPDNPHSGEVIIPSSVTYEGVKYDVVGIADYAFSNNNAITSVVIPNTVKRLGRQSFNSCIKLKTVTIPPSVTYMGDNAFAGITLQEIRISDINAWCRIDMSQDPCLSCLKLSIDGNPTDVVLEEGITKLYHHVFSGIQVNSITIPESVTTIYRSAFTDTSCKIIFKGKTPIANSNFLEATGSRVYLVPPSSVEAYREAWPDYAVNILPSDAKTDFDVTVSALEKGSDLMAKVNEAAGKQDAMLDVISLKVRGTINSYDVVTMRNKMANLKYLDLSHADIVYSDYEYYNGCHTEDNVLGPYMFYQTELIDVKLPESITKIEVKAFFQAYSLRSVTIPDKVVTIGYYAFRSTRLFGELVLGKSIKCIEGFAFGGTQITNLVMGENVESIGSDAFKECYWLNNITFSPKLKNIGSDAFFLCKELESIMLPATLESIDYSAFSNCYSLSEIRIPESIQDIGNSAFSDCPIKDIYSWSVEPTNILQDTFDGTTFKNATLHVPETSQQLYYWDTKWSQFLHITTFNEPYTFIYLGSKDLDIAEETPRLEGKADDTGKVVNPDAELHIGSGLLVTGDESQNLGHTVIKGGGNGGGAASIIGRNSNLTPSGANVNIDDLAIEVDVDPGQWYFMSFPFDIDRDQITVEGQAVWREYDGELRAANGSGGWKDAGLKLEAGTGYIVQTNKGGTITLNVGEAAISAEDKEIALESHSSANAADASWNFVGNPFTSYYELADVSFDAPVVTWNGSSYEAFSPLDDDLALQPYQAFFVQKPVSVATVKFDASMRETYNQSVSDEVRQAARQRRLARQPAGVERLLVNLEITDGETTDKTRVVFNEKAEAGYEIGRDAGKFMSAGVPQIYTIDQMGTQYSINERPEVDGIVRLGFHAPVGATYEISATRMDCEMELVDLRTGIVTPLADAYSFTAQAGDDNDRFIIRRAAAADGISGIAADSEAATYIGLDGIVYGDKAPAAPVVIKKSGSAVTKTLNR